MVNKPIRESVPRTARHEGSHPTRLATSAMTRTNRCPRQKSKESSTRARPSTDTTTSDTNYMTHLGQHRPRPGNDRLQQRDRHNSLRRILQRRPPPARDVIDTERIIRCLNFHEPTQPPPQTKAYTKYVSAERPKHECGECGKVKKCPYNNLKVRQPRRERPGVYKTKGTAQGRGTTQQRATTGRTQQA